MRPRWQTTVGLPRAPRERDVTQGIGKANGLCPTCGQRMLLRQGVQLPPRLADLYDLIANSGRRGIRLDVLAWTLYGGRPQRDAENAAKVGVCQLNEFLLQTDVEVRRNRRHRWTPYKLLRRRR